MTPLPDRDPPSTAAFPRQLGIQGGLALGLFVLIALLSPPTVFSNPQDYLPLRFGLGLLSIMAAVMVFTIGWFSFSHAREVRFQVLACAFLAGALLDCAYLFSFPGMPPLVTPNSLEKALNFWLPARLMGTLALLAVAALPSTAVLGPRQRGWLLIMTLAVVGVIIALGLFFPQHAPRTFIPEQGLTRFKIGVEYAIMALYGVALIGLIRDWRREHDAFRAWLITGLWILGVGELNLTLFATLADRHQMLGHLCQAWGSGLVFWAVYTEALEEPHHRLQISERLLAHRGQELEQARAHADAANRAKSEFLAQMSHEIRTPLNAVLGFTQVLNREPLTAHQRQWVARIQTAGQSLLVLLNDILDFSKIEAGQLRLESRPFDLAGPLARVESLMGQTAHAKGLALRIITPETAPGWLLGDALRLEQVLVNLLGNAIKFTERGEVVLRIEPTEITPTTVRLRFTVRDTGLGMAPEALARLFTPFTQADASISRRYGGTGLGLSICKRLADLMGGAIGAESQVGQGSTVWFEAPFARTASGETMPRPAPAHSTGPRLTGLHLLVVDDSAMNREVVEQALALEGARATLAADGQQAIHQLQVRPTAFDVVLMDVQMPVMDGLTATRLIRDELGLTALPIIAFTAGVLAEQQQAARAAGVNDILAKPLDLEQMTALLLRWVQPRPGWSADHARPHGLGEPVSSTEFPIIAGIDRERAAYTLGGNRTLFLDLLERFTGPFADAGARTRDDLAHGQREAATQRLHTLSGNAGHLGAIDLMHAANALETAIQAGDLDLETRLAAFEDQLAALVAAAAPWRGMAASDPPPPPTPASSSPDVDSFTALREDLRGHRAYARRRFAELQPLLSDALGAETAEALGRAIHGFRFDEALALLEQAADKQGGDVIQEENGRWNLWPDC
ncbi:MAG: response regulator [Candidatus Competibacteraceae bacterium]|nr:response regulator [Candidatus Competibacteraceae bacterium]